MAPLLAAAQGLGLRVEGVSFHVGSGATNPDAFTEVNTCLLSPFMTRGPTARRPGRTTVSDHRLHATRCARTATGPPSHTHSVACSSGLAFI